MEREIKFKVWDIDNKRMFNDCFRLTVKGFEEWVQLKDSSNNLIWLQYTGFKDKNGNDIYGSDTTDEIIKDEMEDSGIHICKGIVKQIHGCWVVCEVGFDYGDRDISDYSFLCNVHSELTVTGNIHA